MRVEVRLGIDRLTGQRVEPKLALLVALAVLDDGELDRAARYRVIASADGYGFGVGRLDRNFIRLATIEDEVQVCFGMPDRYVPKPLVRYRDILVFRALEEPGERAEGRNLVRAGTSARFFRRDLRLEIKGTLLRDDDLHAPGISERHLQSCPTAKPSVFSYGPMKAAAAGRTYRA
jgi:hypothetical protein